MRNVRSVLKRKGFQVITVDAGTPVIEAVRRLRQHQIGAMPVVDDRARMIGIFSERDVVRGLAEKGATVLEDPVRRWMTSPVHFCKPEDSIRDVMAQMTYRRVRHLPVVEDGRLVGLISIGDIVKSRLEELEEETQMLRDLIVAGR
ncbi:CBS domain-containing protein [Rhodothermus bifroesti]|jgi:CBS domain-containing protein|uniref:CBS domain-containing protein n=1 Tax=Rhodothermus marinus TaxID=29549 RepID=A0A7V2B2W1_RHOMR|nr:CBS domain-containing protein [Rhodothermus bifroesti]GBD02262.1 Hypoxic response protein 1 [bacterium HR18]